MTPDEDDIEATRIAGTPRAPDAAAGAEPDATRVPPSGDASAPTRTDAPAPDAPAPAATPRPSDGARANATPSLTPGGSPVMPAGLQFHPSQMILARYRLKKMLGRGGFGVVWRATDENLHIDVAIKFLAPEIVHNPEAIEDLKQETRYSLRLTHPNIVRIHGFFQDAEVAGILMEYVDGGTLQSLKLKRPNRCFEVDDVAKWVPAMCAALDYAHAKVKVVHRDLKPANIMLDAAGDVKVADFGISSSISDTHSRLSMGHATSGTPVYMSPQHLVGQRPSVTDDIYSLGATLFDLLSGKPPFYTGDIAEQVRRVTAPTIFERRRELGFTGAPVPRIWEEVIAACLAKDAASRPASAGQIAVMLGLVAGSVAARDDAGTPAAADPGDEAFATRPISTAGAGSAQRAGHTQHTQTPPAHAAAHAPATIGAGGSASVADAAQFERAPAASPPRARGPNKGLVAGGVAVVLALAAFGVSKMMGGGEGAPRGGDSQGAEASAGSPARSTAGAAASDDRGAASPSDARAARDRRDSDDERATSGASSSRPPAPASPSPAGAPSSGDERAAAGASTPSPPSTRVAPPEPPSAEAARSDAPPPAERSEPAPSRERPSATKVSADDGVRATLAAYEDALESLDAGAYAALWRSLAGDERKKVERAFQQFRAQAVTLSIDAIDVSGATAKARFVEKRTLTPNVGSPITQERKVTMMLERAGDGSWRILEMK